jgi:hypothetical protein
MSIQIPSDMIPVGPYKLLRAEHIIGASAWPWNYSTVAVVRAGATSVEQPHVEVGASRYQWVAASSAVDDGTETTDAILPTGQAPEVTGRWVRIADASDIPDATDSTGGLLTDALAAKLAGIQAGALASAAVTDIANAQASAAVGAIPSATTLVNGLATTTQVTKLDGIQAGALAATAVGNIASNVATGLIASSQVLGWYLANWAVTDWYLDSVNGNNDNDGITAGTALATAEELSRRLAIALPIAHPVTVHVAQGTYGTLAVSVIQTAVACPFDVVGAPLLTSIGPVTTYTDRIVASNQASHLVASGVSDWTAHVGKMVVVTDGASAGAVAWIAKANPNNGAGVAQGVGTARCSRFATPASSTLSPTNKVPASGSAVSLATLPIFNAITVNYSGKGLLVAGAFASRAVSISFLDVAHVSLGKNAQALVDACKVSQAQWHSGWTNNNQSVVRSLITGGLEQYGFHGDCSFEYCLFYSSQFGLAKQSRFSKAPTQIWYSLVEGKILLESCSVFDLGVFDSASYYGVTLATTASAGTAVSSLYGRDNAVCGLQMANQSHINGSSGNAITGVSGDIYLAGQSAHIPWSALPWVDGERSGEATLVAGTVDVTVPYVLATQKMQVCAKTFVGTPGFLSAVYVNATTIRITSSSATDTSVVTWHILPVGDNVVIRS